MRRIMLLGILGAALAAAPALAAKPKPPPDALQVNLVKRVGLSPGAAGAPSGDNLQQALRVYQKTAGRETTGKSDETTWNKLVQVSPTDDAAAQRQRRGTNSDQRACRNDAVRFCRDVIEDDMAVLNCFLSNRTKLSRACDAVLRRHGY
jgi:hypothetical protein